MIQIIHDLSHILVFQVHSLRLNFLEFQGKDNHFHYEEVSVMQHPIEKMKQKELQLHWSTKELINIIIW